MFVGGVWLYLSATRAPSVHAIAVSMLPALAIAVWATWADRHRATT
jgi:hypothetical protein